MLPSPFNGHCRAEMNRSISYVHPFLWKKSKSPFENQHDMSCQSSSQIPMALAPNLLTTSVPRFLHNIPTSSSISFPSPSDAKAPGFEKSFMRVYHHGSKVVLLPRPRGSSRRDASILLCNTALNAPNRAPASAHAASSSSKHARTCR